MTQHSTAYQAARQGAGLIDRSAARGRLVISGADRASYLQGLLTNDVAALTAGHGCYAAYLTAQGRMIADMWVYEVGDVMVMTLAGDVKDTVLARLDQFIFSEDVQLGDVTAQILQLAIVGPSAARVVVGVITSVSASDLSALGEHGNLRTTHDGASVIVTRITDAGEPGFELYVDRDQAPALIAAVHAAGAVDVDPETEETLRIEAGVPRFHRDMDEETIPLEAAIESRAISLTKGCYVGQEVIIRVLHRGHGRVARKLVGLRLEGTHVPASGATVRASDRDAGEVTSATLSPALGQPIALAYLHRDFLEPGTKVSIDGATGEVVTLPFVRGR